MGSIEAMICVKPRIHWPALKYVLALAGWVLTHFRIGARHRRGLGLTCAKPIVSLTLADDLNATPRAPRAPHLRESRRAKAVTFGSQLSSPAPHLRLQEAHGI